MKKWVSVKGYHVKKYKRKSPHYEAKKRDKAMAKWENRPKTKTRKGGK